MLDREGWRVLDVRPAAEYDASRITKPPRVSANAPWDGAGGGAFVAKARSWGRGRGRGGAGLGVVARPHGGSVATELAPVATGSKPAALPPGRLPLPPTQAAAAAGSRAAKLIVMDAAGGGAAAAAAAALAGAGFASLAVMEGGYEGWGAVGGGGG
jgi:rhodanese-related sulfurtransferase